MQAPDIRALLEDAAWASGDIARKHFRRSPDIWDKDDNAGPVTEADLEIDRMLRSELLAAQPTFGWLSEETEDDPARLDAEYVFIVDPIDGTRAFIAGEKHFSHSLAVAKDGEVVAAAVYLPMMDRMYLADADTPATMNGETICVTNRAELMDSTVLAARPNFKPENWRSSVPPLKRKFRPSLAYRLCLVAEGRYDAMLTLRDCWEWDIAAGDLIIRQANGRSTDRLDAPLTFNASHPKTKGCLAAGTALHRMIQTELKVSE